MKTLLTLLAFCFACVLRAAIPANVYGNMNVADANGTAVTTTIMAAGHQGTSLTAAADWTRTGTGLTVETSGTNLLDTVILYKSATSFATGSTHRRLACTHTTNFNYFSGSLPLNFRALAWRGFITFGPADLAGLGTTPYDYISLYKGSHFAVLQLLPGAGPSGGGGSGGYSINIESNGAPTHSPYYTITQGGTYYIEFWADFIGGTTTALVYTTAGSLVHTITSTCDTNAAVNDTLVVHIGNREAGTSAAAVSYFENWTIDYMAASAVGPVGPSSYWTYKYGCALNDASGGALGVAVANVAANDLVCLFFAWEGTTTTVTCQDSGANALTQSPFGVQNNGGSSGEPHLVMFYTTAAVATGTVTYTATPGANRAYRKITAMVCTPPSGSGTIALDGTATGNSATTGGDTLNGVTSGNITTTSTRGIAFSSFATYGQAFYDPLINSIRGVTAIEVGAGTSKSIMSALPYSAGFTGGGASTGGGSNRWDAQIIAFTAAPAAANSSGFFFLLR